MRVRRRRGVQRARTIGRADLERVTKIGRLLYPERQEWRPKTRADCANVPRPCPYVGCRHHLYLEAKACGSIKINEPEVEVWQMRESCSLDVAEEGGRKLEDVGDLLGVTYEAVRRVEGRTRRKLEVLR